MINGGVGCMSFLKHCICAEDGFLSPIQFVSGFLGSSYAERKHTRGQGDHLKICSWCAEALSSAKR